MSSGGDPHQQSRKRPIDSIIDTGGGIISSLRSNATGNNSSHSHRATQAQEFKRRQIMQKSWGFREVLEECGVLEFATVNASSAAALAVDDGNDNNDDGGIIIHGNDNANATTTSSELGCQLDPNVSSSTLRSSINALLSEMSKNGIDPNNARVLKDVEDMIVTGGVSDNHSSGCGAGGKSSLLRRMLLPLYRIRYYSTSREQQQESEAYYDFSQFSQPDVVDGNDNGTTTAKTKIIVESSSLIKVLLRVDALQPTLLTALMQIIPELATPPPPPSTEQDEDNYCNKLEEEEDVPRLIFSNMRWLDHIVDYSSLTNAFVECLTILASSSSSCAKTRNVLLDAIATLPDVLNDSNGFYCGGEDDEMGNNESSSNPILSTLQLLRAEDPSLLVPVLDAIGSLPLLKDQMQHVMRDALEALSSVEGSGLPALTTFIMNHCPKGTTDMAKEVIDEMRKLPLGNYGAGAMGGDDEPEDSFGHERNSSGNRYVGVNGRSNSSPVAASSCLTIESLSRGFAHRPDLTSTLLKSIKETPINGYHPPADIWLLACCASAPHYRPKVKSIFKSKANAGMFTSRLLRESLSGNGMALTSLFETSLCDLADGLLRSSSSTSLSDAAAAGGRAACELGVTLYEILFEEFPEPMHRQEIVGCLVTHVGSGVNVNPSEVDAALRVFCGIIDKSTDGAMTLRPFAPFLTSMLDHLHHMTPCQVRRLFLVLFAVGDNSVDRDAAGDTGANMRGGTCDDVQIVIRKHLALATFAMQRIGIIGTVAFAVSKSSLLDNRQAGRNFPPGSAAVASSPIIQEIKDMISNAYSHCKPAGISISIDDRSNNTSSRLSTATTFTSSPIFSGSSMAFFLDELCHAVRGGRLTPPVKEWIDEFIKADFETWFVGDFEDASPPHGTKSNCEVNNGAPLIGVPKSSTDLALLHGTSINTNAPPGEFRFHVTGIESDVYVKILSLLSSRERTEREFLPVQLSPMFRLMSTLNDQKYGGVGLREIDAVLDCPLLLPSPGLEFKELSRSKQWVVTSCCYFATSWIRQLINSFIREADESTAFEDFVGGGAGSCLSSISSQGMNYADVQKRIIARLDALVQLEEELSFSCSQCYEFAPPGLDVLPPPKLLLNEIGELDNVQNKENKEAIKEAKKQTSQLKKAKQKHEEMLVHRTFAALGQLNPLVCVALGFGDLSIMGSTDAMSGSQGLSQIQQVTKCGGPVTMLLLKLLQKVLSDKLYNRKSLPQVNRESKTITEDADDDNPYATAHPIIHETNDFVDITMSSCDDSSKTCFALLNRFLRSGAFASLYEHLAAVAELRCGPNRKIDDAELECQLVNTARCLFSCVTSIMGSDLLTRSATGRMLLASILKQVAQGDRNEYSSNPKRHRISTSTMNTLMGFITDNVNEIVVGAYTCDMSFAMDGVTCMQTIFECSQRLFDSNEEKGSDHGDAASILSEKLFTVSDKLLHQNWPDDTKMNKGNIGVLLSLFVEHSPNRMTTLSHLVHDVLQEVGELEKGEVVPAFPTCSHQTIGYFHSTVLHFLWKEIEELFHSTDPTTSTTKVLNILQKMADLLKNMSDISHEHSNKKFLLLQHLKLGSRFVETFVLKAIPFCQVHFREHQETILDIIRSIQTWTRGLYHIVSHGKRKKDAMMAKEAPRAKKALETFIHKVKAMLKKNNCMTAMWTKTLKSKGVDGKVLKEEEGSHDKQDDDETDRSESEGQSTDDTDTDEELDDE